MRQLTYFRTYGNNQIAPTLCPEHAINKTDPLDQFYTKPEVAQYCLDILGNYPS